MALPSYNTSLITSVARVQQNIPVPQYVLGGQGGAGGTTYGLFKKTTSYVFSVWRSSVYKIGKEFDVMEIKIPLMPDLVANMTITPVLYFDNEDSNSVGTVINSTNYPNSDRLITLTPKNFSGAVRGKNNFFLELQFSGSALSVVQLPISIDVEVVDE